MSGSCKYYNNGLQLKVKMLMNEYSIHCRPDEELLHTNSWNCNFLEDMWRYDCASRII
jgi:hypothetical protein